MRIAYIKTSAVLTTREMLRNRFAVTLLITIPALFFTIVWLTTGEHPVMFNLASVADNTVIEVSARNQSLVFIGVAAIGLITSFLAMNLMQKNSDVNRRLVLCGFHPSELVLAKLLVLFVVVFVVAFYLGALLLVFFRPAHFLSLVLGFALAGLVHSCYGLLVGSLVKRELEGILLIVLLVNIDAGWLQNPLYYAEAHNRAIIRFLPAYFPSQASIVSAFTDHSISGPLSGSIGYAATLLAVSILIYFRKMRIGGYKP
ncbi:MAG: ABC transporter permease [Pyrinomonadaceae bacterium]